MVGILSSKYWAVTEASFERFYPIILNLVSNGQSLDFLKREGVSASTFNLDPASGIPVFKSNDRVAYIPIVGGLTKYGDLCSIGMRELSAMVKAANESPNIDAILLVIDSPGGSVDGTSELGHAVASSLKPTVVFSDHQMGSAAYWIGSQADFIYANSLNNTEVGSIGALYVHVNETRKLEKEGREVTIFRASQSINKAKINSIEPLTDELRAEINEELTEITEGFISTVKSGRGNKLNTGDINVFDGTMFNSKKALKLGLIDAIGTMEEAVAKAATMAKSGSHKKIRNSKNNNKNQSSMKLIDWFKKPSEEGSAVENLTVQIEELEQFRASALEASGLLETATARVAELEVNNTTLTDQIIAKDARIAELELQVTTLENKPAREKSAVAHQGDVAAAIEEEKEMTSWEKKQASITGKIKK